MLFRSSSHWSSLWVPLVTMAVCLILAALGFRVAVQAVERNWRETMPLAGSGDAWAKSGGGHSAPPRMRGGNRRRQAGSNPVLELGGVRRGSLSGVWFGLAIVGVLGLLGWGMPLEAPSRLAWWCLWLGAGFAGSAAYRRELESGALELLLVTPLHASEILGGRWWVILRPVLQAGLILGLAEIACRLWAASGRPWDASAALWMLAMSALDLLVLATIVLVGMTFSVSRLPFPATVSMTWMLVLILPAVMAGFQLRPTGGWALIFLGGVTGFNLARAWQLGLRQLTRREFVEGAALDGEDGRENAELEGTCPPNEPRHA